MIWTHPTTTAINYCMCVFVLCYTNVVAWPYVVIHYKLYVVTASVKQSIYTIYYTVCYDFFARFRCGTSFHLFVWLPMTRRFCLLWLWVLYKTQRPSSGLALENWRIARLKCAYTKDICPFLLRKEQLLYFFHKSCLYLIRIVCASIRIHSCYSTENPFSHEQSNNKKPRSLVKRWVLSTIKY